MLNNHNSININNLISICDLLIDNIILIKKQLALNFLTNNN